MREMKVPAAPSGFAHATASQIFPWPVVISLFFFGILGFELINQLKPEWWLNPQYNYGILVPLLALHLLWRRWSRRPSPQPRKTRALVIVATALCASLFLPIRFSADSNPYWRLLSWLLA